MMKHFHTRHGLSDHPLYRTWMLIKQRCENPAATGHHKYYGGRGISIDPEWRERPDKFIRWIIQHLGDRPSPDHQLDRIDNDGDYQPGNLRWATRSENLRNQRRNRLVSVGEITLPVVAWAEIRGVSPHLIFWRLNHGWSDTDAVVTPPGGSRVQEIIPESLRRWRDQARQALCSLAPLCGDDGPPPKVRPLVNALGGVFRSRTVAEAHIAAKSATFDWPSLEEIGHLKILGPEILDGFFVLGEIEFESLVERIASKKH